MSLIIVPLAGPDFYTEEFGIRPLYPYGGSTLLQQVLQRRPWFRSTPGGSNRFVFVLRDEPPHTETMIQFLSQHYPDAKTVVLSSMTGGALLSAIAGISLIDNLDEPVVIDLADIVFDWDFDAVEWFAENKAVDAVVPYFLSTNDKFSYLFLDEIYVVEAREKQRISENASAGAYLFRNAAAYLRATAFCLENPDACRVGPALFVCPCVNGIISSGRKVAALLVGNPAPVSLAFHKSN